MSRLEDSMARAHSLSRATPRQWVPRKLVHQPRRKPVEGTVPRCINVRYRHEPRAIRRHDLCPACDNAYLAEIGWKEGLRCPECGWLCKSEQPVGGESYA